MVTTYTIEVPCSYCGKIRQVKLKGYCSGSCKVKAFRDKGNFIEKEFSVKTEVKVERPVFDEVGAVTTFSDKKKPGYHFNAVVNGYVKD